LSKKRLRILLLTGGILLVFMGLVFFYNYGSVPGVIFIIVGILLILLYKIKKK